MMIKQLFLKIQIISILFVFNMYYAFLIRKIFQENLVSEFVENVKCCKLVLYSLIHGVNYQLDFLREVLSQWSYENDGLLNLLNRLLDILILYTP